MPPHLDLSHRKSWNTSIPRSCILDGRSIHHPWESATPDPSAISSNSITWQTLPLPTATTKCVNVGSVENVSTSVGIRTTSIATRITTKLDVTTSTISLATPGDDFANPDPVTSLSQAQASGVTAASLVILVAIIAACVWFARHHSRVRLCSRKGLDDSASSRQPLRHAMRTEQVLQSDVEVVRHRDTLLHRGDGGFSGADEQTHSHTSEEHQPDLPAMDCRQNSRPVSGISSQEEGVEDVSSTLEAMEMTNEIESLADHALTISEVRHPVLVSSATSYNPGMSCSRFSISSSDVDEAADAARRRATMPSLHCQSHSASW